jgi:hypothetical protein
MSDMAMFRQLTGVLTLRVADEPETTRPVRLTEATRYPRGIFDIASTPSEKILVDSGMSRSRHESTQPAVTFYGPTLSSIQMLPETSATVSTSFSWVSERSTGAMFVGTIRLGLLNDVTWKGSPTGFPLTASKRMPHALKKPSRPETKYIVFPSGDHRGLSSQCLPSVMRIHWPPVAAIT